MSFVQLYLHLLIVGIIPGMEAILIRECKNARNTE